MVSPVKVFGHPMSTNVARVLLVCLEEVGAEYELVTVDFLAGEHNVPDHVARNPFGKVPALQDGDLVLFESRAIAKYILHKYKSSEYIIFPIMHGTATKQKVVDESLEKLKNVLEVYEAHLSKHRYLAGDSFSFADLNHFPFTFYFMATPYASMFDAYPRVKAWWQSLISRPSIKKISANMPTKF
ncbi:unnamed protein product [Urochloa decumbens]|uniref:glutathione transferase n=1 Tax=Urochloa decumbens TaxID=240449 RepID=A0ABC8YX90_9POAL